MVTAKTILQQSAEVEEKEQIKLVKKVYSFRSRMPLNSFK